MFATKKKPSRIKHEFNVWLESSLWMFYAREVCRLILARGNWAMPLFIHWRDFAIISNMHSASRWALFFIDEESNSVKFLLSSNALVSFLMIQVSGSLISLSSNSHEVIFSDRHIKCWLRHVSLTKTQVLLLSRFQNRNARYGYNH